MVRLYNVDVDLPQDNLLAYARMVIFFGTLEGAIKLAIKNLAISTQISANSWKGLREAEMRRQFGTMREYMLELHRQNRRRVTS